MGEESEREAGRGLGMTRGRGDRETRGNSMGRFFRDLRAAVGLGWYYARKQYGPAGMAVLWILLLTFWFSLAIVALCS